MTIANQLHDITVDGQQYIINRSGCITGRVNYYSGRKDYRHEECTRWRWAENQGYHALSKTHIALMCFCRKCSHKDFVIGEWLQSESFTFEHTKHLRRQSERKVSMYPQAFERVWAEPLHETVKMAVEDLDHGDMGEAKIKLSTILDKIKVHKRNYLAVEGWEG